MRAIFALFYLLCSALGSFVITVPKKWCPGENLQVCIQVANDRALSGLIMVKIHHVRKRHGGSTGDNVEKELLSTESIFFPHGDQRICRKLHMPKISEGFVMWPNKDTITVSGRIDGMNVTYTRDIERQINYNKTIIQTEKYLYKPGQTVQFRVLSHYSSLMNISTENYNEIYITSPSNNRLAQWLDVDNSKGLVHLSFPLADEPEKGVYSIKLNSKRGGETSSTFEVNEYVLPKFEVTVKPPKYILPTMTSFTFTACANYTFGEPVTGMISWKISNLQSYVCHSIYNKNDTIYGCTNITVNAKDVRLVDCITNNIRAEVVVTEAGTGVSETAKGDARVERRAVIFEKIFQDKFMKPNLPFKLEVLAKLPDGSPASNEPLEICHGGFCRNLTTPSDGIVKIYLTDPTSRSVVIKRVTTRALLDEETFRITVKRYYSPSNSSLLIHASNNAINCTSGETTNFMLKVLFAAVRQEYAYIYVQVMSRGRMQYVTSDRYKLTATELPFEDYLFMEPLSLDPRNVVTGVLDIPLNLPSTASPKIKVLIWYIKDDGEMVSDVKDFDVKKCLPNKVDFMWTSNNIEPGRTTSMLLSSAPSSICSYGVADKSVELLSPREDAFTVDNFFIDENRYSLLPWLHPQADDDEHCRRQLQIDLGEQKYRYYSEYVDALTMFDQSGVYIFTDLTLETRPCTKQEIHQNIDATIIHLRPGDFMDLSYTSTQLLEPGDESPEAIKTPTESGDNPRTYFPETWLWDLDVVPWNGMLQKTVKAPDTVTEWIGKAVCVHPDKGVGVSKIATLKTFTPFFVDVTHPPSIKLGEVVPIKISVFNYLERQLPITLTVARSSQFEFVGEDHPRLPAGESLFAVDSRKIHVRTVRIRPILIGEVNITVKASVDAFSGDNYGVDKSDTLIRSITVEAGGFLREKSWSKYICSNDVSSGVNEHRVPLNVPITKVANSERAWVTAVGDLISISLQNLGSLIRMPYGCGEQNLVNFAPNIFILKYLQATNQETPEAKDKLLKFMGTGYQRQLLYRRTDGSYSAFGKADRTGSNWLTAFVLKSFTQAKEFILIDERSLSTTSKWLINSYGNNTCAQSVGKIFSKGLKGGLATEQSTNVPLTAYILISLMESGVSKRESVVQRALRCLTEDTSLNHYTVALKAYALSLSGAEEAHEVLDQLLKRATVKRNSTHWELPKSSYLHSASKALEVETAGYALLAMMAASPTTYEEEARKIVKWISFQRNGRGGFYSTQDTVVALQALSTYESRFHQDMLGVTAIVQAEGFHHTFHIDDDNKLVLQQATLPKIPTNVVFTLQGQGCAMLQAVLRYNDPQPDASEAFTLRVNSETEEDPFCLTKRLSVCASYRLPDGFSNMAVIEVNLISGYIPKLEDLEKLLKDNKDSIKRYEVNGNQILFYIEQFTTANVCVNFRAIREVNIENAKQATVLVYDYYQPEFARSKKYYFPPASECRT